MPYINVGKENSAPIDLYYEDHGSGQPMVLIHGYPLDGHSWEKQVPVLLDAGKRVITYDRRGFGKSSQPTIGYDYDTFAADLKTLIDQLDLREIILVGFSMGTGEVTRYLGNYGSTRAAKAALFGPIPPFLLQTDDNPLGVPQSVFDGFKETIKKDRYAWFKFFFRTSATSTSSARRGISDEAWNASFAVAAGSSAYATLARVPLADGLSRRLAEDRCTSCSSSRALRTASCPSMPRDDGFPTWSATLSSSRSRADHTTSDGLTPKT